MENNATGNHGNATAASESDDDYMDSVLLRAALITAYSVIFLLGVAGNVLVVYVVARNTSMQTTTNVFIANLAASDIMMCLLAVPFTPISGLLQAWPFGDVLCHLVPMTLGVSVYVSTLTSTAIAVDRYCVIVHPFLSRMHVRACLLLIAVIWMVAVSISLPLALYQRLVWYGEPEGGFYSCEERWPGPASRQLFTIVSMVFQYVLPCLVIIYCYARVSIALRRRARSAIGTSSIRYDPTTENGGAAGGGGHGELRNRMRLRRKRRTNRMLMAMVGIFAVCWLPLNVIHLSLEYDESLGETPYFLLVFFAAHVVAMSSTVYNPFLYAWMNDNFRKEFRRVLPTRNADRSLLSPICNRRRASSSRSYARPTTAAAATRGNAEGRSPSLFSTVGRRTEQGGSGDRPGSRGSGLPAHCASDQRTLVQVHEERVRFVDDLDKCDAGDNDGSIDDFDVNGADNVASEHHEMDRDCADDDRTMPVITK